MNSTFYTLQKGVLLTAPSLGQLLPRLETKPEFNHEYLAEYFYRGILHLHASSKETLFKNIYRAPFDYQLEQGSLQADETGTLTPASAQRQFNTLLHEAVSTCLPSTGGVGLELSGGLDSSAVAALTRHFRPHQTLSAFTNGVPTTKDRPTSPSAGYLANLADESYFSQTVAKHLDLQHVIINDGFHFHDIIEQYTEILGCFSEILFPIFNHRCYELARERNISVLLSGFGGDEMVSQHAKLYLRELKQNKDYLTFYYELIRSKKPQAWLKLLSRKFTSVPKSDLSFEYVNYLRTPQTPPSVPDFPTVQAFEQALVQGQLSSHFMHRIETSQIIARHYGIEYHFPLTTPALMQYFHQLPSHLKRRHGKGRYLMRHAMRDLLPNKIVWRENKAGATTPAAWANYIRVLPELFLQRISPTHSGVMAQYVDIPRLITRFEQPAEFYDPSLLKLSLTVMMFAHLEKWLKALFNEKSVSTNS